jgi:hypothetical protein
MLRGDTGPVPRSPFPIRNEEFINMVVLHRKKVEIMCVYKESQGDIQCPLSKIGLAETFLDDVAKRPT